jgi:hypothetical protein
MSSAKEDNMQIVMAVACDSAVEYAGRLSLLGTFDTLETDHFPLVKPQCSLAIQIQIHKV